MESRADRSVLIDEARRIVEETDASNLTQAAFNTARLKEIASMLGTDESLRVMAEVKRIRDEAISHIADFPHPVKHVKSSLAQSPRLDIDAKTLVATKLIEGIVRRAARDAENGVPDYDRSNTGDALEEWIKPTVFDLRSVPRVGDARGMRKIYTAARFLLRMHDNLPPKQEEDR